MAILKRDNRFIYYLVTKPKYNKKPTYDTLRSSLNNMKHHCADNNVTRLSMPCIGCGLDKLDWDEVSTIICETFCDLNITITVYQYEKPEGRGRSKRTPKGGMMDSYVKKIKSWQEEWTYYKYIYLYLHWNSLIWSSFFGDYSSSRRNHLGPKNVFWYIISSCTSNLFIGLIHWSGDTLDTGDQGVQLKNVALKIWTHSQVSYTVLIYVSSKDECNRLF